MALKNAAPLQFVEGKTQRRPPSVQQEPDSEARRTYCPRHNFPASRVYTHSTCGLYTRLGPNMQGHPVPLGLRSPCRAGRAAMVCKPPLVPAPPNRFFVKHQSKRVRHVNAKERVTTRVTFQTMTAVPSDTLNQRKKFM